MVNFRLGDFQTSGAATDENGNPVDTTPATQATYYQAIRDALNDWEALAPDLRFVEVPASFSGDLVLFERDEGNGCHSFAGRLGGTQRVHLSDWCFFFRDNVGNITGTSFSVHHEIGHALGFRHEHQRADRGSYVVVTDTGNNFDVDRANDRHVGDYDCESVMHYNLTSVVDASGNEVCPRTGQRTRLSAGDARAIAVLYPALRANRSLFANTGKQTVCYLRGPDS